MIHPQITGADARISRVVCPLCDGAPPTLRQVGRFSPPEHTECPACENWGTVDADELDEILDRYGLRSWGAA